MTTEFATVTGRGQVTIPARIRRRLGLKVGSRVTFEVDADGRTWLRAEARTVDDLYASVPPLTRPEDFEHHGQVAWEEAAAETARDRPA